MRMAKNKMQISKKKQGLGMPLDKRKMQIQQKHIVFVQDVCRVNNPMSKRKAIDWLLPRSKTKIP
jgi:hypothetical protein